MNNNVSDNEARVDACEKCAILKKTQEIPAQYNPAPDKKPLKATQRVGKRCQILNMIAGIKIAKNHALNGEKLRQSKTPQRNDKSKSRINVALERGFGVSLE